ncbi:hypothetical protein, partial [Endozoicomonas acroporae]|uniref:hypothetical protein n=1 Tax=Endozoicomonas acroporae TaxID=1701104 RepID=UPI003D79A5EE
TEERVKKTQAAVLSTLLDRIILNCNQTLEARDLDVQGINNLLWSVAKLVDNGLELEKTPKLKEAVVALLTHVKAKAKSPEEREHFIPQHIANLLWSVAKLVDNGLVPDKALMLREVVAALLPHVKAKA